MGDTRGAPSDGTLGRGVRGGGVPSGGIPDGGVPNGGALNRHGGPSRCFGNVDGAVEETTY